MRISALILFLASLLLALSGWSATLEWDANPPEQNVHRYNVWAQSGTNAWVVVGTVTNATILTIPTPTNTTRFAVSALTLIGFESPLSEAVEVVVPTKPKGTRIRLTLQSADSPTGPWTDQTNTVLVAALPASGFVRGKMEIER